MVSWVHIWLAGIFNGLISSWHTHRRKKIPFLSNLFYYITFLSPSFLVSHILNKAGFVFPTYSHFGSKNLYLFQLLFIFNLKCVGSKTPISHSHKQMVTRLLPGKRQKKGKQKQNVNGSPRGPQPQRSSSWAGGALRGECEDEPVSFYICNLSKHSSHAPPKPSHLKLLVQGSSLALAKQ